ncbi:MAG: hypothetical protein ACREA4_10195, partial [Nitrososphaera sp.]
MFGIDKGDAGNGLGGLTSESGHFPTFFRVIIAIISTLVALYALLTIILNEDKYSLLVFSDLSINAAAAGALIL